MAKKIIIVGGVAGGASAAARLRRMDEQAEIILLERDEYISFANCGLPYYIGGSITERERLLVQTPEAMKERFNLDVRIHSEAINIDPQSRKVTIQSRERGSYEENYDFLILSPGAKPLRPPIPGIDSERVYSLRNIPDTDAIKAITDRVDTDSAIVIGGGFIGVEMAENLRERNLDVTLVEAAPHILPPFDQDIAQLVERELSDQGVKLILGDGVEHFADTEKGIQVKLSSGQSLEASFVILAIGVTPDTAFLQDSGITLGTKGHIVVNEKLQTNFPDIYAVGDAVELTDAVTGKRGALPLAGPANKQGRIAADRIAGLDSVYKGYWGSCVLKIFDQTAAATGASERTLRREGITYHSLIIHPASHATYYPGAQVMTLKLLFNEQGRVLGAQAVGMLGVDKRIDVIAAVMQMNGTVYDLAELELSYAPPFSSAKDPVNMAGFAAQNLLAGLSHIRTWEEIGQMAEGEYTLLDVRTEEEFANGHAPGAVNLPVDSLRAKLDTLDKNKPIVEYCRVGLRGYIADRILSQNGFDVANVTGGILSRPGYKETQPEEVQSEVLPPRAENPLGEGIFDRELDARGLCCPGPLLQVKAVMDQLENGQILKILASDPGFYEDIQAWSKRTGHELIERSKGKGVVTALLKKQEAGGGTLPASVAQTDKNHKTIIVFSGDLDKALAAFIIANGAASMGRKVTMFFTFWGLNILRKEEPVPVPKGLIHSLFGKMMPRGAGKLALSKMNMGGMGTAIMRKIMKDQNISSLEDLIQTAKNSGIELVACQMSMDVMGIHQEELLEGVKSGGVGYMLGEAEESDVNFFI